MLGQVDLTKVLKLIFRPLIAFCVRHSIKYSELDMVIKELFVKESESYLKRHNKELSVSKISIMTGLQRPLVGSFKDDPSDEVASNSSLMIKVIGAWQTMKRFSTTNGKARVLTINGKESEFAKLVKSVSQALNPYTVLFELERAKLVERTPKGIKLLFGTFKQDGDIETGLSFLSSDINDLCHAVDENIFKKQPKKNHHVTTEYDNIPASLSDKIKDLFLKEGNKLHFKMRKMLSSYDRDTKEQNNKESPVRAVFTSYSRIEGN